MKRWLWYCLPLAMLVIYSSPLFGDDDDGNDNGLEGKINKYGEPFATGFTKPLVDVLGASLNSGWYQTANVSDGISIFLGVKVMALPIPDDEKTFSIVSPGGNHVVQQVSTIFGPKKDIEISGDSSHRTYPQGLDVPWAPMAVPQLSVGNIFGTRVMLRYIPTINVNDIGDFSFFGIGVQHSVSQYLPGLPVDLAGMIAYQKLSLGSFVSAKAFTFGGQASKSFSVLTLYAGLAYETYNMSFSYDAKNDNGDVVGHVSFDESGTNTVRLTGGLSLDLAILKINADYTIASQPVVTAGIGFGW